MAQRKWKFQYSNNTENIHACVSLKISMHRIVEKHNCDRRAFDVCNSDIRRSTTIRLSNLQLEMFVYKVWDNQETTVS